jgi:hypothetical protein
MKLVSLLVIALSLALPVSAQRQGKHAKEIVDPCDCHDPKGTRHYRYAPKHETDFDKYPKSGAAIASTTLFKWQKNYSKQTKLITEKSRTMARVKGTPEDTLYTLKGWLYFVKDEGAGSDPDCDYHIEIGLKKPSGQRAVVEITKDNCALQKKVADYLIALGHQWKNRKIELTKGIPCMVVGLGFYDGAHPPSQHGRATTAGSSWELHPVKSLEFEE